MLALSDLELFVRAADARNLSQAARELDILPATASAVLKRLEQQLGVGLVVRSTRALRLTPEGEAFLVHARRAIEAARDAEYAVATSGKSLRGHLRISAPPDFGRVVLNDWLDAFQAKHSGVTFSLLLSDRFADFYRERVDLAVRYGKLDDSSLVSRTLSATNRRMLCAAPGYLERAGTPAHPNELSHHACLAWMMGDAAHTLWTFKREGEELRVRVTPTRISDDGSVVREWALAGAGIAYKAWLDVADDVGKGRLVTLLDDWHGEPSPLNLMFAFRDNQSPLLRATIEFLAARSTALSPPPPVR